MNEYEIAKKKLDKYVAEVPLNVQVLDRETVVERSATNRKYSTVEQRCVNYLRHCASAYDEIIQALNRPEDLAFVTKMERHVLYVERRSCVATIKRRILDEIAEKYPWLQSECVRQKQRDGVEDDVGNYVLPFGPFKGFALRDIEEDYLLRLLGQSFVRKAFRTRIERHLAERRASAMSVPQ
jgi:hypothetical protein